MAIVRAHDGKRKGTRALILNQIINQIYNVTETWHTSRSPLSFTLIISPRYIYRGGYISDQEVQEGLYCAPPSAP